MVEQLHVQRVGHRGDGIAVSGAREVFVPYSLPGETVEVDDLPGHPDRRHLVRIIAPSPDRTQPPCPHFTVCGGCMIQHWKEDAYRAWKRGIVAETLASARIDCSLGDLIDAHGEGRRRAVLHARTAARDSASTTVGEIL